MARRICDVRMQLDGGVTGAVVSRLVSGSVSASAFFDPDSDSDSDPDPGEVDAGDATTGRWGEGEGVRMIDPAGWGHPAFKRSFQRSEGRVPSPGVPWGCFGNCTQKRLSAGRRPSRVSGNPIHFVRT